LIFAIESWRAGVRAGEAGFASSAILSVKWFAGGSGSRSAVAPSRLSGVPTTRQLLHTRPYKPAWSLAKAVAEIRALAGRQFDPAVVRAFEQLDPHDLAHPPDSRPGLSPVA
jgi:hypothetical protein